MKILDERGLSGIVKRLLDVVMAGGIIIILTLPFLLKWYLHYFYGNTGEEYWFLLPFLYITGFLALIIINSIRRVFNTLNRRNPFMPDNVKNLKHMAYASFAISFSYIVKIIFYNSFLTIILAMVFMIAGLFSIIFSEVFQQAVIVKEENDLTI